MKKYYSTKIRESILEEVKKDEIGANVTIAECSSFSGSPLVMKPGTISIVAQDQSNNNLNPAQAQVF